jgi:hypothetical protein
VATKVWQCEQKIRIKADGLRKDNLENIMQYYSSNTYLKIVKTLSKKYFM